MKNKDFSNINEFTPIEMHGDAPNRHARRTVENLIADHVADAMAIQNIAWMFYCQNAEKLGRAPLAWKDVPVNVKESHLRLAQSSVLGWLNREQGTDYQLED